MTIYPDEATVFTVHAAQLVLEESQVKHYSKLVAGLTHDAWGAEDIIEAYVSIGQLAWPL